MEYLRTLWNRPLGIKAIYEAYTARYSYDSKPHSLYSLCGHLFAGRPERVKRVLVKRDERRTKYPKPVDDYIRSQWPTRTPIKQICEEVSRRFGISVGASCMSKYGRTRFGRKMSARASLRQTITDEQRTLLLELWRGSFTNAEIAGHFNARFATSYSSAAIWNSANRMFGPRPEEASMAAYRSGVAKSHSAEYLKKRARAFNDTIQQDRRRAELCLPQRTKFKFRTAKSGQRNKIRCCMRALDYEIDRWSNDIWYDSLTRRDPVLERKAESLSMRVLQMEE